MIVTTAIAPNPWRWGEYLINLNTYSSSPSIGNLYNMPYYQGDYPEQFGFRITEGTVREPISVNNYPEFSFGWDDPITGRTGIGSQISNLGNWHDTTIGETRSSLLGTYNTPNYETCNARSPSTRTSIGSNMLLNWPTLDLTDPSIEKVELKFDMMHNTSVHPWLPV